MVFRKLVPLAMLAVACGGATESDLFAPPPTTTKDATTPPPVDASADATVPPLDSGPADTGADRNEASVVDPDPGILCTPPGSSTKKYCTAAKEFCCLGSSSAVCYASGSSSLCNSNYNTPIACDDTADCVGAEICCGYLVNYGYAHYSYVACNSACTPSTAVPGFRRFCDPNLKPTDCPGTQVCQASSYLPGYYVCN